MIYTPEVYFGQLKWNRFCRNQFVNRKIKLFICKLLEIKSNRKDQFASVIQKTFIGLRKTRSFFNSKLLLTHCCSLYSFKSLAELILFASYPHLQADFIHICFVFLQNFNTHTHTLVTEVNRFICVSNCLRLKYLSESRTQDVQSNNYYGIKVFILLKSNCNSVVNDNNKALVLFLCIW